MLCLPFSFDIFFSLVQFVSLLVICFQVFTRTSQNMEKLALRLEKDRKAAEKKAQSEKKVDVEPLSKVSIFNFCLFCLFVGFSV